MDFNNKIITKSFDSFDESYKIDKSQSKIPDALLQKYVSELFEVKEYPKTDFQHFSNRIENQSNTEKPEEIVVYAFEPKQSFYDLSFDEKLKIVDRKIVLADADFRDKYSSHKKSAGVFVAPEYLFKNLSKPRGPERFHNHQEKKQFIERMQKRAKESDLVLIPGTICWRKPSKKDQTVRYRNTSYLFYKSVTQKYKKQNETLDSDLDYIVEKNFEIFGKLHMLFKVGGGKPIRQIGPLRIGMEICLDNLRNNLYKQIGESEQIDLHLIIADGVKNPRCLRRNNLPMVKIERNSAKHQSIYGRTIKRDPDFIFLDFEPAEKTEIEEDLHSYHL